MVNCSTNFLSELCNLVILALHSHCAFDEDIHLFQCSIMDALCHCLDMSDHLSVTKDFWCLLHGRNKYQFITRSGLALMNGYKCLV